MAWAAQLSLSLNCFLLLRVITLGRYSEGRWREVSRSLWQDKNDRTRLTYKMAYTGLKDGGSGLLIHLCKYVLDPLSSLTNSKSDRKEAGIQSRAFQGWPCLSRHNLTFTAFGFSVCAWLGDLMIFPMEKANVFLRFAPQKMSCKLSNRHIFGVFLVWSPELP